jgi:hypothetical protein
MTKNESIVWLACGVLLCVGCATNSSTLVLTRGTETVEFRTRAVTWIGGKQLEGSGSLAYLHPGEAWNVRVGAESRGQDSGATADQIAAAVVRAALATQLRLPPLP